MSPSIADPAAAYFVTPELAAAHVEELGRAAEALAKIPALVGGKDYPAGISSRPNTVLDYYDQVAVVVKYISGAFARNPFEGAIARHSSDGLFSYLQATSELYERAHRWVVLGNRSSDKDYPLGIARHCEILSEQFAAFRRVIQELCCQRPGYASEVLENVLEKLDLVVVQLRMRIANAPQFTVCNTHQLQRGDVFTTAYGSATGPGRILLVEHNNTSATILRLTAEGKSRRETLPIGDFQALVRGSVCERRMWPCLHPSTEVFREEAALGKIISSGDMGPGMIIRTHDPRGGTLQVCREVLEILDGGDGAHAKVVASAGHKEELAIGCLQEFRESAEPIPLAVPRGHEIESISHVQTWWAELDEYAKIVANQFSSETLRNVAAEALDPSIVPFRRRDVIEPYEGGPARMVVKTHPLGMLCLEGPVTKAGGGQVVFCGSLDACGYWKRTSGPKPEAIISFIRDLPMFFSRIGLEPVALARHAYGTPTASSHTTVPTWEHLGPGSSLWYPNDGYDLPRVAGEVVLDRKTLPDGLAFMRTLQIGPYGDLNLWSGIRSNADLGGADAPVEVFVTPTVADFLKNGPGIDALGPPSALPDAEKHLREVAHKAASPFAVIVMNPSPDILGALNGTEATLVYIKDAAVNIDGKSATASNLVPKCLPTASGYVPVTVTTGPPGTFALATQAPSPPPTPASGPTSTVYLIAPSKAAKDHASEISAQALRAVSEIFSSRGIDAVTIFAGSGPEIVRTLPRWLGCAVDAEHLRERLRPLGRVILFEGTSPELDRAIGILKARGCADHPDLFVVSSAAQLREVLISLGIIELPPSEIADTHTDPLRRFSSGICASRYLDLSSSPQGREFRQLVDLVHRDLCQAAFAAYQRLDAVSGTIAEEYLRAIKPLLREFVGALDDFIRATDRPVGFCEAGFDLVANSPMQINMESPPRSESDTMFLAIRRRLAALPHAVKVYGSLCGLTDEEWQQELRQANIPDHIAEASRLVEIAAAAQQRVVETIRHWLLFHSAPMESSRSPVWQPPSLTPKIIAEIARAASAQHGDPNKPDDAEGGVIVGKYPAKRIEAESGSLDFCISGRPGSRYGSIIAYTLEGHTAKYVPAHILASVSSMGRVRYLDLALKDKEAAVTELLDVIRYLRLTLTGRAEVVVAHIAAKNVRSLVALGKAFNLNLIAGSKEAYPTASGGSIDMVWFYFLVGDSSPQGPAGRPDRVGSLIGRHLLPSLNPSTIDEHLKRGTLVFEKLKSLRNLAAQGRAGQGTMRSLAKTEIEWTAYRDQTIRRFSNGLAILKAFESGQKCIPPPRPHAPAE